MWEKIPPGRVGSAEVSHFQIREGKYARLLVNGEVVMSDTDEERRSNLEVLERAHRDVLIGGLGLGMLVFPILEKDNVRSLTVVEKNPDVYDLILPHMPDDPRLAVVEGDIFTWEPHVPFDESGASGPPRFNTIYFDIWTTASLDNLKEMARLHWRFRRFLDKRDPHRFMGSWQEAFLRSRRNELKQPRSTMP